MAKKIPAKDIQKFFLLNRIPLTNLNKSTKFCSLFCDCVITLLLRDAPRDKITKEFLKGKFNSKLKLGHLHPHVRKTFIWAYVIATARYLEVELL